MTKFPRGKIGPEVSFSTTEVSVSENNLSTSHEIIPKKESG